MLPFQFTAVHDDFYSYHLSMPTTGRWLERHLALDVDNAHRGTRAHDFLERHLAYQPGFLADNVWLYYFLLNRLWGEQELLCLDVGETGALFMHFPLAYTSGWEYVINYEELDEGKGNWSFTESGWCPAKTEICVEYEGRDLDWDSERHSPVFHLNYRTELIQSLNMLDPGLFASRNYMICSSEALAHWQQVLQAGADPDLERLLEQSLLVVMNFGEPSEEGFGDYVLIKSHRDRQAELNALTQELEAMGQRYEKALERMAADFNFEAYLKLLHECFELPVGMPILVN